MSCPHCGYDADPGEEACPLCGTPLDDEPGAPDSGTDAVASGRADRPAERDSPADGARGRTPWEARGGVGALVDSWWESLSDPGRFFARVDWEGGWSRPLLYYLIFVVLGAGLSAVWYGILGSPAAAVLGSEGPDLLGGDYVLLQFFLTPFTALISLAFTVLAAHGGARILAERPRPIGATARTLCYAAGPQALLAIPAVGGIVAFFWSAFVVVVGLREAHRVSTLRAVGVLLIAFFLLTTFMVGLAVLIVAFGMTGALPIPRPS